MESPNYTVLPSSPASSNVELIDEHDALSRVSTSSSLPDLNSSSEYSSSTETTISINSINLDTSDIYESDSLNSVSNISTPSIASSYHSTQEDLNSIMEDINSLTRDAEFQETESRDLNKNPRPKNSLPSNFSKNKSKIKKTCWICLSDSEFSELDPTERQDSNRYKPWIYPCICRGTLKWVHQACLRRWVDMKQNGDLTSRVKCPQCDYTYNIVRPKNYNSVKYGRQLIESYEWVSKLSLLSGGLVTFITCLSGIGAIVSIRVCGQQNITKAGKSHPILSFFLLTLIGPALVFSKQYSAWEAPVMKLIARLTEKNTESLESTNNRIDRTLAPTFNRSLMRLMFGALLTPIIGSYVGEQISKNSTYFSFSENIVGKVLRCLVGSSIYVSVKGILKTCYLYNLNEMHKKSTIGNYKKKKTEKSKTVGRFQLPLFN